MTKSEFDDYQQRHPEREVMREGSADCVVLPIWSVRNAEKSMEILCC
jgi:hypothetical protein